MFLSKPTLVNIKLILLSGLSKNEIFYLTHSIKQFINNTKPVSVRFWGKVFGTINNYYILEVEENNEIQSQNEEIKIHNLFLKNKKSKNQFKKLTDLNLNFLPKSEWKEQQIVPSEEYGKGTNRKSYYVCNILGDPWIRLPDVTPNQVINNIIVLVLHF